MQGIIMAAGRGSRIKEIAGDEPKSFLTVHNMKLIEYNIALLHAHNITDILIVTGYETEKMEECLSHFQGIRTIYNPFYESTNVLGSFYLAQEWLNDDVVYLHADTLCEPKIFEEMLSAKGDMVLPIDFTSCNEEAMKVTTKNGRVDKISKEISLDIAEGEFIGILKMGKEVLGEIKKASKKLLIEKQFTDYFESAIQTVIDESNYEINTLDTKERFWGEIDFYEDYQKVCEEIPTYYVEMVREYLDGINGNG